MPLLRKLRHQVAKSPARAPLVWYRHKTLKSNDAFLGSYPRSGSTWLRFVLFESLAGQSSGFLTVDHAIPDVKLRNSALPLMPGGGRLIKTHEIYHSEYRKAVYLVRDPRDVALSEFAYQTTLGLVDCNLDEYLNRFLREGVNPFAAWRTHVESWLSAPLNQEQLLFLRFEDLRKDTFNSVVRIAEFLGLTPDEERIRKAIANNTVDRMRAKEKETPTRVSKKGRFVGKGSVGGWRGQLNPGQAQLFRKYAGEVLERMGYPLDAEPVEAVTA
jgi:hypothetical protein